MFSKLRGGDHNDGEPTTRRRQAPSGVVSHQRSHSATAASRRRLPAEDQDPVVGAGADVISADTLYTVMVLGSHGVGKTTVTQQLLTSEYLANKDYNVG